MKTVISLFLMAVLSTAVFAQKEEKFDRVIKLNGDEMVGTVKEVTSDGIKFTYKGENLTYDIKKSDIFKITYSSGRSEVFTKPVESTQPAEKPAAAESSASAKAEIPASNPADRRNKVAVLPFTFLRDNQSMGDDMAYQVQNEVYAYIKKHSATYTILDPRTTNALLMKAGIKRENMMGYTMVELCSILGVEYLVDGSIKQSKGVATTSSSANYDSKSTNKNDNKTNSNSKSNEKVSGSSYTTTSQPYSSNVTINVYNDKGDNIYAQNRTGMFASDTGAYDSPLDYLLKRSPFYSK